MLRITGRVGYALVYVGENRKDPKGDVPGEMSTQAVLDVLGRLEQYENTGLEPGEIAEMVRKSGKTIQEISRAMDIARISGLLEAVGMMEGAAVPGRLTKYAANAANELNSLVYGSMREGDT